MPTSIAFAIVASAIDRRALRPRAGAERDAGRSLGRAQGQHDRIRPASLATQGAFVVAQVSLSLVLLVTSGMFLDADSIEPRASRSGSRRASHVLAASFDLGLQGYTPERATTFITNLEQRAAALPGVTSVSTTNDVPMGETRIGADIALDPKESDRRVAVRRTARRSVREHRATGVLLDDRHRLRRRSRLSAGGSSRARRG